MYIIKNTTNEVPLSLSEAQSQLIHDWLFEFTNEMTGEIKYCYASDISTAPARYNLFIITDSIIENPYNGTLNFTPTGTWSYKVYEMPVSSPPSIVTTGNYGVVETGVLVVYDSTEDINNNFTEEETKNNGVFDE